ncbi:putative DNA-binding protein [Pseudogracilibacillus auburnensis]
MLYDFYHELLTNKQKEYMELYYREDYSLGEISNLRDVSRQAVYDNIKRTEQLLHSYEEKLHLYEKFMKRNQLLTTLQQLIINGSDTTEIVKVMDKLQKID